jgi:hypothetical protein
MPAVLSEVILSFFSIYKPTVSIPLSALAVVLHWLYYRKTQISRDYVQQENLKDWTYLNTS